MLRMRRHSQKFQCLIVVLAKDWKQHNCLWRWIIKTELSRILKVKYELEVFILCLGRKEWYLWEFICICYIYFTNIGGKHCQKSTFVKLVGRMLCVLLYFYLYFSNLFEIVHSQSLHIHQGSPLKLEVIVKMLRSLSNFYCTHNIRLR